MPQQEGFMALSANAVSKIQSVKRCDSQNISELIDIFASINNRVRSLLNKILVNGTRLQQKETRELHHLLRAQSKLLLLPVDPGSGNTERNLFNNQCHRVQWLRETIREIERRHKFKILDDY
jgi:hypothetical protein